MEQLRAKLLSMDKKRLLKIFLIFAAVLIVVGVMAQCAFALNAPTAGSKFEAISDLVVNDVVQGPIGYSLAVICGVFTAGMMVMSKVGPAVGGLIGTAVMTMAPTIVQSMGAIIC